LENPSVGPFASSFESLWKPSARPVANDQFKLTPLTCGGCGSTVPLADSSQATCSHCGASVPIPKQYREWRHAKERELASEQDLFELHESLGKNPTRSQKLLVKATESSCCSGCLLVWLTGAFGGQLLYLLLSTLEYASLNLAPNLKLDQIPGGDLILTGLILLPYVVVLSLTANSLFKLRQKTKTLIFLQSNLVAAPPVHEGGEASCRNCGASLDVQKGKVTATCYYCLSHNLVALDPEWVGRLRNNTEKRSLTLKQALDIYEEEQRQGRGCLGGCGCAMLFVGVMLFSSLKDSHNYEPPKSYPEPQNLVFQADLNPGDNSGFEKIHYYADTKKKKFRTTFHDLVLLGDLSNRSPITYVDPVKKRFFVYTPDGSSELRKELGEIAEARYLGAWRSYEKNPATLIRKNFQTPCALNTSEKRDKHPLCETENLDGSLQKWSHHFKNSTSPVVHMYRADLGVTTSGTYLPTLENIEIVEKPDPDLFEVPKGFQNALSDEVLADKFFESLGTNHMIPGMTWSKYMTLVDSPAPPSKPLWTYQTEQWTKQNTQAQCVFIRRAYCRRDFDPKNLPDSYDEQFIKVKQWDEKPEIGDFSFRHGDDSIVFVKGRNIFSVSYTTDLTTSYPVLEVAKQILKRAEERGKPVDEIKKNG